MRKESCGFLYKVNDKYLIVHPFRGNHWSIPKGCRETGETSLQAAIRELQEETGQILLPSDNIKSYGTFPYIKGKDLTIFEVDATMLYSESKLGCSTFIEGSFNPEVNGYMFVTWKKLLEKVNKSQRVVLEKLK